MHNLFLVHQAGGGIAQGQESVVVGIHPIAVAGERVDKQFQLVVGSLRNMDAHPAKGILHMVGTLLYIRVWLHRHYQIIVGIYQLLVFPRYHLLHSLDVLHGYQIAWVWHTAMTVLLFVEHGKLTLLIRHKDDLVIHHTLHSWYVVHQGYQIHWHAGVVHLDIGEWAYLRRQIGTIDIHQTIHLAASVTHTYRLVIHLESCHAHRLVTEVHGKEAVNIHTCFLLVQELRLDTGILQLVLYLSDFHQKISPFLVVERHQTALLVLLRNGQIGHAVRIFSSVEIAEVGF